jgi:hypothetical protein
MNEQSQGNHANITMGRHFLDEGQKLLDGLAHNDPARLDCATGIAHAVYDVDDLTADLDCLNGTISMMRATRSSLEPVCEPARDFVAHLGILLWTRFQTTSNNAIYMRRYL